jgi:hypothetical protein
VLNKNKRLHILLWIITTLYCNTVIVWFLELQATCISAVVGTCTISIQPDDICKQRYYKLHQTAIGSFAPIYFHDLSRTSAIPAAFLHGSPQPLMAHVVVVLHTKLNMCPHSNSFCHCRPYEVGALAHHPEYVATFPIDNCGPIFQPAHKVKFEVDPNYVLFPSIVY